MRRQVEADLLADVEVAEVDDDGHEQRGEQHEKKADAVDAHEIADAEGREPGAVLHELHAGDAISPVDEQQKADQERQDRRQQGNRLL